MKKAIMILSITVSIVCYFIAFSFAETGNSQKSKKAKMGMIPDGAEVYDLNGEWDALYHNDLTGTANDVIKITQEGYKFVGIKLIGKRWLGKGSETIRGELIDKIIDKSAICYKKDYPAAHDKSWSDARAVITEDGNKIIIQSFMKTLVGDYLMTITLTRK